MIRNLKALGLALCAVFAFGALAASAASAANDVFTSGSGGNTFLTGEQVGGLKATPPNVFGAKSSAGTIECEKVKYVGSYTGATASEVELTPTYEKCKSGVAGATVTDNGCKFVLTGTTDAFTDTNGNPTGKEDATVSLNCNHTGSITATLPGSCVITFSDTHPAGSPVNQNLLGVKYDNEVESAGNKKWDIKATVTVDKITYTSNSNCTALGFTATDSDGFLTTGVTVKAYEDSAHTKQVNLTQS
jgi:hypothetical protein